MVVALGQEKNIYISCGFNSSTRHGDDITAQNAVRSDDADCAPKPAESGRDRTHGQHYEYWNQATLLWSGMIEYWHREVDTGNTG
jgi:hypothetical protein